MIPHSKPWITKEDLEAVNFTLNGLIIAQSDVTVSFENKISDWVNGNGGVAVGSGTAAIYLALDALGIGHGDEVIIPTYVCASVVQAVVSCEATPIICDVGETGL